MLRFTPLAYWHIVVLAHYILLSKKLKIKQIKKYGE